MNNVKELKKNSSTNKLHFFAKTFSILLFQLPQETPRLQMAHVTAKTHGNNITESIQYSHNSFSGNQTTNPAHISQTCMDSISAEQVLAHSNADT